jgi:hypothetical protein
MCPAITRDYEVGLGRQLLQLSGDPRISSAAAGSLSRIAQLCAFAHGKRKGEMRVSAPGDNGLKMAENRVFSVVQQYPSRGRTTGLRTNRAWKCKKARKTRGLGSWPRRAFARTVRKPLALRPVGGVGDGSPCLATSYVDTRQPANRRK